MQHFSSPASIHADVEENCSFCHESISGSRSVSVSVCGHHFHSSSIKKWLKERSDCPLCRRDVCIIADTKALLHYAAAHGQQKAIGTLINRGANVNFRIKDGRTSLHCAAQAGKEEAIDVLIARGADVNARTKDGRTPLHCAAAQGQRKAIDALITRGANVNARTTDGRTPLHCAAEKGQQEVIAALIARGANVNARTTDGRTPLHCAAEKGQRQAMDALIAGGANVNARTGEGDTALQRASDNKKLSISLIKSFANAGFDVSAPCNYFGSTMLVFAAEACDWEFVDKLKAKGADINAPRYIKTKYMPLHFAAEQGQQEAINALITRGANVDARTTDGRTPLHCAAEQGQQEAINALITRGANVNARTTDGRTPLHCAAEKGQRKAMDALIARGANVNARTEEGDTALKRASDNKKLSISLIKSFANAGFDVNAPCNCLGSTMLGYAAEASDWEFVDILKAKGADINAPRNIKTNYTPLHFAAEQGQQEAIVALITRGANVNARTEEGDTALKRASDNKKLSISMIKSFANAGFDVNAPCNHLGSTMLVYAAQACDWGFVDKLKAKGADINAPRDIKTKYTPLHFAAERGQQEAIHALITRGADVNAQTTDGRTPLHFAAEQGQQEAIDALIARGADVNARTKDGKTPLQYATEKVQQDAVVALIAYGATLQ
ncbi:ankyrin repeat domain-containing protein [Endozoicomonas sp. GU-1]|uniref:ankyrin repeat domain-containing protein n=1 Tax=Endozoicomonas sp. GU-1 TaxID=3009078 RepID=UPI002FC335C1